MRRLVAGLALFVFLCTACSSADETRVWFEKNSISEYVDRRLEQNHDNTVIGLDDESLDKLKNDDHEDEEKFYKYGGFYYEQLSDEKKASYQQIYNVINEYGESCDIYEFDEKEVYNIFLSVLNDNPQFYMCNTYSLKQYKSGDEIYKVELLPEYNMTEAEVIQYRSKIDEYFNSCKLQISNISSEYEIVKSVYDYIVTTTRYEMGSTLNQTICSVMAHNASVCQGYAKTMQYILGELDISSMIITGIAEGVSHAWNIVEIDGKYYQVDVTWADSGDEASEDDIYVDYSYLCITTDEITRTRTIDTSFNMPICESTDANYYVKEGLLLQEYTEENIRDIIIKSDVETSGILSMKAADQKVYDDMIEKLINDKEMVAFMEGIANKCSYTDNQELLTITFFF